MRTLAWAVEKSPCVSVVRHSPPCFRTRRRFSSTCSRTITHNLRARGDRKKEAEQLLSLAYQQARQTGLRGFLAYYEQALEVYRKLGNLHVLGGFLVDLGVGLALSYRGKRLRGKRARVLAYWRVGLDVK